MLEYPEITSAYLFDAVETGRACQALKMRKYYAKLVGGVTCSNNEQLKVALLVFVVEQAYKLDLTCFDSIPVDSELSYLRNFINYLEVECADCGFRFSGFNSSASTETIGLPIIDTAEDVIEEAADELNYILLEDATYITLEDESGSHLMENN
jgi:hypothetical protein